MVWGWENYRQANDSFNRRLGNYHRWDLYLNLIVF